MPRPRARRRHIDDAWPHTSGVTNPDSSAQRPQEQGVDARFRDSVVQLTEEGGATIVKAPCVQMLHR
jgi:hypothetical protein